MKDARLHVAAGTSATVRTTRGRPRLLILTPDFPPTPGGVQVLVHRLALAMTGFQIEVLTLESPGARRFDSEGELATRRVGAHMGGGPARILALNAGALRRALRFRPDVTLSAHVVTSPAAAVVRRLLRARTAQYFYANEILGKPRLSAFAAARADVVIAISAYTASLIAATGTSPANLRLIPPGVDLPRDPGALPAERPTVLTIAQLKHSYKGHDVLIRALAGVRARVPDVEWVVIGEGPLRRVSKSSRARAVSPQPHVSSVRSRTRSATPGCGGRTCSRCRAASPARASGSSIWRRAPTASRSSPATSRGARGRRGWGERPARRPDRSGRRDRGGDEAAPRS